MPKINCAHAEKECPISKSPCPGVCIYGEILQNMHIGIIVLDAKNEKIIFQNKFAKSVFRSIEPEDYRSLRELLIPDNGESISSLRKNYQRRFKYRGRIYGYTVYALLEDYLWVFLNDITDKQRLESIAEAVNTMENIGYVFSGIRHEIGNPINSIKMTVSVLKNNIESYSSDTVRDYIDRIFAEILRVEFLLKSLKSFSMYETPDITEFDVKTFMEKFVSLISDDFERNGITINLSVHPDVGKLRADPRMIQQALLNLLTNSSDALKDKENPEIMIRIMKIEGHVVIQVSDTGCGISQKELKNVFKPFYTTKTDGTGLGLVIVKKMLATMKGTVSLESYENVGTIVTVTLPEKGDVSVEQRYGGESKNVAVS